MEGDRKLVSVVFTDIKGYTAMMEKDEAVALSTVERFEKYTKEKAAKHNGHIVNFMGDGALITFESGTDAVSFGVDIQTLFLEQENIQHRIGINTGEVLFKDGNVYGDCVNVAARIESLGVSGSLLISESTCQLIRNKKQFEVKSMGPFHFKNKKDLLEVFAVTNEPLVVPSRKDLKGKTEEKKFNKWWFLPIALLVIALAYSIYQLNHRSQTENTGSWAGTWIIEMPADDNEIMIGELVFLKENGQWHGEAVYKYDVEEEDLHGKYFFTNIMEEESKGVIKGEWTTNIVTDNSGNFEFKINDEYTLIEGHLTNKNQPGKYFWKGHRK